MMKTTFLTRISNIQNTLHHYLDTILPRKTTLILPAEAVLIDMARYASLPPGKAIRPYIIEYTKSFFPPTALNTLHLSAAVELAHTYSLIHDDLPCMDNGLIRRGKPTTHIQYGEAPALLLGNALLTYAFEMLASENIHPSAPHRCALISHFAHAVGFHGMIAGQMADISPDTQPHNIPEVYIKKTGALFHYCVLAHALSGEQRIENHILFSYIHHLSLAFQITDDLMDLKNSSVTGKSTSQDLNKLNILTYCTPQEAEHQAEHHILSALKKLEQAQATYHANIDDYYALQELTLFVQKREY